MAGEVEVIAKMIPKNAAFTGIVDAAQVLDGTASFGVYFSGITAGTQRYRFMPFACTIIGWEMFGNAAGDIVIDVKKCAAIDMPATASLIGGGGTKPTLSSAIYATDVTLTDWTLDITAGDVIEFVVDSVGETPTWVNLDIKYRRTVLG